MFTHLNVHSYFSLTSGVSSPEALVEAAVARGYDTLACTDTNGVYGAVEFQQAAEAAGIRPILGAHLVSVVKRSWHWRPTSGGGGRCAGR